MRRRMLAFTLVLAMLLGLGPAYAAGVGAEEPAGEILSFTPLEQTEYTVPAGTPAEELGLPDTVAATVRETVVQLTYTGAEEADMPSPGAFDQPTPEVTYDTRELETDLPVTWESQPAYDPDTAGAYTFTARAVGYALAEGAAWPAVTVTVEPAEEPTPEPAEEPTPEPTQEPAQAAPNSALDGGVSLLADTGPIRYQETDSTEWTYTSDLQDIEKWLYGLPGFDKPTGPDIIIELVDDYLYADSTSFVTLAPPFGTLCIVRSAADGDEIYSIDDLHALSISETAITLANIEVNAVLQVMGSVTHLIDGVTIRGNGIYQQAVFVQHDGTSPGELILSGTATIENGVYLSSKECKLSVEGPFNGTASVTEQNGSQAGGVIGNATGIADGEVVSGITCATNPNLQAVVNGGQLVWHDPTAAARYSDASGTGWTYTDSLSGAVTGVPDGGYVELLKDATLTEGLTVGDKAFTLRSYSDGEEVYTIERGGDYTDSLFTVSGTGDVTLADIVLDGNQEAVTAAAPLLTISGGTVTMNSGSTLQNNKAGPGAEAAGVYMTGGTFTLEAGAEISGNVLETGGFQAGGIQVEGGTAYLRGRITGNEGYDGGGVLVDGADANVTITGQITNNRASAGGGVYVAEGSATLDGATVTGNMATSYNTGGAFLYNSRLDASGSSLTLTGQVTITGNTYKGQPSNLQIYTSEDQPRTVTLSSDLGTDSNIGVRILTDTGLFATGEVVNFSDYVDVFTPDDGSYIVQAKEDGLYLTDSVARMSADGGSSWTYYDSLSAAINAVDGGTAETNIVELLDDVTAGGRVVQNKSLTLRSSTEEGAETYTITRAEDFGSTMFNAGTGCTLIFEDIVLDGGSIDATSGTLIWANGGTVILDDGAVVRNCVRSSNDSGAVEVNTTGTLTMRTGAAIENSRSGANGGAVKVAGTFNMEGGSITGSSAATSGGGVAVDSGGIFNMTGGSITGSSAGTSGGGVYVATGGAINLSGAASISDNTAGSAASNLYLASGSTLTLTGELTGAENSIGVTIDAAVTGGNEPGGTIGGASDIADSDDVTQIFSDVNSELVAVVESGALKWQEEATGVARYSADGESGWIYTETLSDAIANVPSGGFVELLTNVTLTEGLTVSDKSFTLRSNSDGEVVYTIERGGDYTGSLLTVSGTGNVTLADIVLDGGAEWGGEPDATLNRGTTNNGLTAQAALVQLDAGALTLNSGAVLRNNDASDGDVSGGGVYFASGELTMESGSEIRDNYASRGAGIYMVDGSLQMNSGSLITGNLMITAGTGSEVQGAGVRMISGTAVLGGTISHNKGYDGGGVCIGGGNAGDAVVTITGTVTDNYATYGGGVYFFGMQSATIGDGAVITRNHASSRGGGVMYNTTNAPVTVSGTVTISGNTAGDSAAANNFLINGSIGERLIELDAVNAASEIGIYLYNNGASVTGLFATGEGVTFSDYVGVFTPDDGRYIVQAQANGLYLTAVAARYSDASGTSWTYTATLGEAIANVPSGGFVELLQDVTLTERITVSGKNFTLRSDSGGTETHTIIRGAEFDYDTNEPQTDTLFYVNSGGSMTLSNIILDGGAVWDGPVDSVLQRGTTNTSGVQGFYTIVITGESTVTLEDGAVIQNIQRRDESAGAASATGAALLIETGAEAIMKDGSLIQNVENEMSAVYIGQRANGTFTMEGGTIRGCQANRGSAGREGASAVTVRSGSFTMGADATICNNKSIGTNAGTNIVGGTVLVVQATAQINGTIRDNSAAKMGGGVIALEANSVTIGGTITNNTAPQGGGVFVRDCTITLDGATITGNTATNAGGGVYLHNSATVQLTGETSVTDNQVGSADSNVCLAGSSAAITLTSDLTDGASVGVTQSGAAAGVSFGAASSAGLQGADKFFCDSDPKLRGVLSGTDLIWGQYVARLVGGAGDGSYYTTLAAAVAAYSSDTQYIAMVADSTGGTVTVNQNLYLDLAGHTVANGITVGEGFTLYGFDSTTNGYDSTGGYGRLTGAVNGAVADVTNTTTDQTTTAMRYLKVTEDGGVSFHRFDMKPKSVVFRPSAAGIYFTGLFYGDEQVKNAIQTSGDLTFGLYFGLEDPNAEPTASNASAHDPSTFTTGDGGDTRQGAMVQNIVTEGGADNADRTAMTIYVSAYFNFADAGVVTRDTMNEITLTDVIRLAAAQYSTLDDTQQKAFDDFWVKFSYLYSDEEWAGNIPDPDGETP